MVHIMHNLTRRFNGVNESLIFHGTLENLS